MFCRKCGALLDPHKTACEQCKEDTNEKVISPGRRFYKIWLLILTLLFIGLTTYFMQQRADHELNAIVKLQIKAIKEQHYTEAYYAYTSKDFRATTSLKTFKEFIKKNPVFEKNTSTQILNSQKNQHDGLVRVQLKSADQDEEILFSITKQEDQWKIQSIQIEDPQVFKTQEPPYSEAEKKDLISAIDKQLKALQKKDLKSAYFSMSSKEFLQQTPFENFENFIARNSIFNSFKDFAIEEIEPLENKRKVVVTLNAGEENISLEYILAKEKGEWKIFLMQILLPPDAAASDSLMHPKMLSPVVEDFLKKLQQHKEKEAYDQFTTAQFKKITTPSQFQEFLHSFSILSKHTSYTLSNALIENDDSGRVVVKLEHSGEVKGAIFDLEIENQKWLIDGIQEIFPKDLTQNKTQDPTVTNSTDNETKDSLIELIKNCLGLIHQKRLKEAYENFTSKEHFQTSISFAAFKKFLDCTEIFYNNYHIKLTKFSLNGDYSTVLASLILPPQTEYPIEFQLVKEDGQWKIFYVELYPARDIESSSITY